MGEDNTKGGETGENIKEKEQKDEQIIVLKVDMHCEACAKKVVKALRTFPGVEDIAIDRKASTIGVKGKIENPVKLCERIHSKTGRNALVMFPLPKSPGPDDQPKDDNTKDYKKNEDDKAVKDQPPPVVIVVLQVQMHCEACAQLLRKRIRKVKGVESVETNVGNGQVRVKGVIPDPEELAKYICKKTRKQVSIVKNDDQEKSDQNQETNNKEEVEQEKKEETTVERDEDKIASGSEANRYEYNWQGIARYNYMDHPNYLNNYEPQFFSDENPNACSIM